MQHLFDSELRLMELIWETEPVSAVELSRLAAQRLSWNKNTTYTVLKKLVAKEAVLRREPGFLCTALLRREDVRRSETKTLIDKLFGGSRKAFLAAFLEDEPLDEEELAQLRKLIDGL